MKLQSVLRTSLVVVSATLTVPASAELVTNGGFETGDFTGWTVENAPVGSNLVIYNDSTPFGSHYASFAANGGDYDGISQLLATTAGQEYSVSFWVNNFGVENDSLLIDWEGVTVQNLTPLGTELESWTQISFNVTALSDGSLFRIRGFDAQSAIALDAISVTQIPAPGVAAVLAALPLLGNGRRRRRAI